MTELVFYKYKLLLIKQIQVHYCIFKFVNFVNPATIHEN